MAGGGILLLTVKRSGAKILCVGVRGPGVGLLGRALRILPVWNSIYGLHGSQATCTATHLGQADPRLRRMAYKLQHWLIDIQYIPGTQNTLADALSREERQREVMPDKPGINLAEGIVEVQPPQNKEEGWQQPPDIAQAGNP